MKLVGAWLGEDFDSSVTELVVFGGKRILIDANLANRRLGRKLSGCESIDIKLPAIGPGRRPGQRFQVRLQLIRIVGQRFQILAAEHDRARIIRGVDVERRSFRLHVDLLLFYVDVERYVKLRDLARCHVHVVLDKNREPLSIGRDGVLARR